MTIGRKIIASCPILMLGSLAVCAAVGCDTWVVLLSLLMILFLAPLAFDLVTNRFDVFEVRNAFLGVLFLDLVLGLVNAKYFELFWVSRDQFERWVVPALMYANVALLSFYLGYYLIPAGSHLLSPSRSKSIWRNSNVVTIVTMLTSVGVAAHVMLVEEVGGFGYFISHVNDSARLTMGRYYLLLPATRFPIVAAMICYLHGRLSDARRYEYAGLGLFALNILKQVTLSGRAGLILNALGVWAIAHYTPRPRAAASYVVRLIAIPVCAVCLCAAIAVATVLHNVGPLAYSGMIGESESVGESARGISLSLGQLGIHGIGDLLITRFSTFESFLVVIGRAGRVRPAEAGSSFVDLAYMAVPRAWWRAKPFGFPVRFARDYLDLDATSGEAPIISPCITWPGQLYLNFLTPGLILGMTVTGFLCKLWYRSFRRNPSGPRVLFYCLSVLFFFPLLDAGLDISVFSLVSCIAPAVVADWLCRIDVSMPGRVCTVES